MKCEDIKDLVLEYAGGDLRQDESSIVEEHLRECTVCSSYFEELNRAWSLLDGWEGIEPSGDFIAEFWQRVSEEDKQQRGSILDPIFGVWKVGVALALIVVIFAVFIFRAELFKSNISQMAEKDMYDERILLESNEILSKDMGEFLEIYGLWSEELGKNSNSNGGGVIR